MKVSCQVQQIYASAPRGKRIAHAETVLTTPEKFLTYQIFFEPNPRHKIEECQFKSLLEDFTANQLGKTRELKLPAVQGRKLVNLMVFYKSTPSEDLQCVLNKHGVIFTDYKRAYNSTLPIFESCLPRYMDIELATSANPFPLTGTPGCKRAREQMDDGFTESTKEEDEFQLSLPYFQSSSAGDDPE